MITQANIVLVGDCLERLRDIPDESVQMCCTSPAYWGLRDYQTDGQLGLETTPEEYVEKLVKIFREVKRVLKPSGTLWLNLGDTYYGGGGGNQYSPANTGIRAKTMKRNPELQAAAGFTYAYRKQRRNDIKPKDLVGIPWRVAFALQADGWWLRSDIIWAKPNPMPESVQDRPTKSHEYIFLLTKSRGYYYDAIAVAEPISESYATDTRPPGILRQRLYENSKYQKHEYGQSQFKNLKDKGQTVHSMHKNRANGEGEPDTLGEGKRNRHSVWTINTQAYSGAHFATFPEEIPTICIKAGTKTGDIVLDCFAGSGTTLEVAKRLGRQYVGIELNEKYVKELIEPRLHDISPLFEAPQERSGNNLDQLTLI